MKKALEPRACANPNCKKCFTPSRKDQEFCSTKCYNHFSNDLTDEERKDRAFKKAVRKNDSILGEIYRDCEDMNGDLRNLSTELLKRRKFKSEFYKEIQLMENCQPIYWMKIFGVQFNDKKNEWFTLQLVWRKYNLGN